MAGSAGVNRAQLPGEPGGYALLFWLEHETRIRTGRFGTVDLAAGHYLYMGSALSGMAPRLARHLRRRKKRHWHVDSLTSVIRPHQVWWVATENRMECEWAELACSDPEVTVPVRGFGASDCRCNSHLVRVENEVALGRIWNRISDASPGADRLDVGSV